MEDVTEKIASLMNLCVINDEKKLLGEVPMEIRLVPLLLPLPSLLLFLLSSYLYAPPRIYSSLHRVFLALTVTVAPPQQPQQQSASLTARGMLTPAVWGGVEAVIFVAVAAFAFILCVSRKGRTRTAHPDRLGFGNVYGRGQGLRDSQSSSGSFQPRVGSAGQAVEMRQQARRLSMSLASPSLHLSETSPHRGNSSVRGHATLFGSRSPQGTSPPSPLCLKLCLSVIV